MTYKLYTDGPGFLVLDPEQPENAINVPDLHALMDLRVRIGAYFDNGESDGAAKNDHAARELTEIDTATARRLASQQGHVLKNSALVYACDQGNITGAHKVGGRYRMPKWAFLEWLEGWKVRREVLRVDERGK